jgi:hypothetical protein
MSADPFPTVAAPLTLEDFARKIGIGRVSLSKRQTIEILGVSERTLDEFVRVGRLQPFRHGEQKLTFWGPDVVALMWADLVPIGEKPSRQRKPRSQAQRTPPTGERQMEARRRSKGRPPKVVRLGGNRTGV